MKQLEGGLGKSYVESARSDLQHDATAVDANARKIERYSVELVSAIESLYEYPRRDGEGTEEIPAQYRTIKDDS